MYLDNGLLYIKQPSGDGFTTSCVDELKYEEYKRTAIEKRFIEAARIGGVDVEEIQTRVSKGEIFIYPR